MSHTSQHCKLIDQRTGEPDELATVMVALIAFNEPFVYLDGTAQVERPLQARTRIWVVSLPESRYLDGTRRFMVCRCPYAGINELRADVLRSALDL